MSSEKPSIKLSYYLTLALKHRWVIIIPFCISMVTGIYFAFTLPKIYSAQTLILVEPQRVPSEYVRSIVSTDIESRISTISQQIMSRTNIEKIINEYKLLDDPKYDKMYQEDKLEMIRKQITVNVTKARGTDAFTVEFQGKDPKKVMNVANALASYFIDENLKVREAQAIGTSDFLENEKLAMMKRLEDVEKKLQDYKTLHMGELPEQLNSNLNILDRLQEQRSQLEERLSAAKYRVTLLRNQGPTVTSPGGVTGRSGDSETSNLDQLKEQLTLLQAKYTENHPDVVKTKKIIAEVENRLKTRERPLTRQNETSEERDSRELYSSSRQSQEIEVEIRSLSAEISNVTNEINRYKQRIEVTPKREQELLSLTRDYNNILESYNSLLNRKLEAEIAVNMEKKQKGEQFRIIDPAKMPEKPVSPNMIQLLVIFLAVGLGSGGCIVFLVDLLDTSFKSKGEVELATKIPVLAVVPVMAQPRIERWERINDGLSWVSAVFSLALCAIFIMITLKGVDQSAELALKLINIVR